MSLRQRTAIRLLAVLAVFALVVGACGGSDEGGGDGGDTTTTTSGDGGDGGDTTTTTSGTPAEPVELTFYMGNVEANVATAEALIAAFEAANPGITIDLDSSGPGGSEGDNIVKTKLATDDMADLFWYNSGSLFQALNPDDTLLNMDDQPWIDSLNAAYIETVSTDNGIYGAPAGTATGGGVFYYVPDYVELGLEVPTTWDEFMANNAALLDAGKVPVIQSFGDTWTSQIFVLADFYNVYASDPNWAAEYTAGDKKYADDPVALEGFKHGQEVFEAGYLNQDYASMLFADALNAVGSGAATHYPMLTFAITTIVDLFPEAVEDVGFFAMPGDGANGLTVWMPPAIYSPKTTEHPDEVKKFLAFVASVEGCEAMTEAVVPTGPYLVTGCTIPTEVPRAVSDMLPYFELEGATSPALEFLSPIKGPALEQITVEVGSGIRSAEDGAALYDEDVKKQAQQLGLPGWDD